MSETQNEINPLIRDWLAAKVELDKAKEIELTLRNRIANFFIDPKEGANTLQFTPGYSLKLTHKINRKIDEASLDAIMSEMSVAAREGLIVWKPNLALKIYKALSEDQRRIFDQTLTIGPAAPTLEFIPKKD